MKENRKIDVELQHMHKDLLQEIMSKWGSMDELANVLKQVKRVLLLLEGDGIQPPPKIAAKVNKNNDERLHTQIVLLQLEVHGRKCS